MSEVLIHQVYNNSPAQKAGIRVNDKLISVNGKSAIDLGIVKIKEMLMKSGQEVDLVIEQDGQEKAVSLILKSLI